MQKKENWILPFHLIIWKNYKFLLGLLADINGYDKTIVG